MERACKKASQAIARDIIEIEKLQVLQKGINNFVTATDIKAEKIITEELMKARPNYGLLLEEGGFIPHKDSNIECETECTWIVDPIDGTSNFIHANPNFVISVALRQRHKNKSNRGVLSLNDINIPDYLGLRNVIAGVIYLPLTDEMYWAEKNSGAYHIDNYNTETKLRVSGRECVNETLFATAYSDMPSKRYDAIRNNLISMFSKPRISGSSALDLAYLASGKLDIALYNEIMLWDVAAGLLIASEAGANFRILYDDEMVCDAKPYVRGLLVANYNLFSIISNKLLDNNKSETRN